MEKTSLPEALKFVISRKLRQLSQNSRNTLKETALFLHLDYAQYYRILHGQTMPQLDTFIKITRAYGLDLDWWFKDIPEIMVRPKTSREELKILGAYKRLDERSKTFVRKMLKNLAT